MSAIFITILKKLGTRLLLSLAEVAVDELGGRSDNPVSRDTVDVLRRLRYNMTQLTDEKPKAYNGKVMRRTDEHIKKNSKPKVTEPGGQTPQRLLQEYY